MVRSLLYDCLCFFSIYPYSCSEQFGSAEPCVLRTVNEHCHFVVYAVSDFQDFGSCHPSFLLRKYVQPFQSVLNITLAQ
jgi:hypothetical protein